MTTKMRDSDLPLAARIKAAMQRVTSGQGLLTDKPVVTA